MLEPESRHLLLDALRPPQGYTLDLAVGTTYSLDLLALMTAPVAFAMFDRQGSDGALVSDPIAMLQALREHAGRISLFCQAGQIAVPPEFRSLLVYLEGSVFPVVPLRPESIFHPKVWYLRFRQVDGVGCAFRLLCLSRNLTFDRSWDTVLRLDGQPLGTLTHPELAHFSESLISMAAPIRPVPDERAVAIRDLGLQFASAEWDLPNGFDEIRFWPLGHDGLDRWPFERRRERMLVVSPFVTGGALADLTRGRLGSILLSRPETFDHLGGAATQHLAERLVLSSDTAGSEVEDPNAAEPGTAESADHRLVGLHAKTYVADAGRRAQVWTGSANATHAAFHGNVEFLVELGGRKDHCGVEATLGMHADRLGLRKLVQPYEPTQLEPLEATDAELAEQRLDRARRAIGGLRYTATCAAVDSDRWALTLHGVPTVTTVDDAALEGISTNVRPVTLGRGAATIPSIDADGLEARYQVSEAAVTPFFALTLAIGEAEVAFLVSAELVNPPPGRAERVLSSLIANRADLIRFLLLLLGNLDDALAAFDGEGQSAAERGTWLAGMETTALLEPLVRAFSRDPERLRDIERIMVDLRSGDGEVDVLPERWDEIWSPIATALAANETP